MSLNIHRDNGMIRIRYHDEDRSGEIIVDLNENKIIIYQIRNLRVVFEVPEQIHGRSEEIKEQTKINLSQLRHALKKEIIDILTKKGAFTSERSLSLDDILEIAQYEKDAYLFINKLINEIGGLSKGKRLLALILAALRREGKVGKTSVEVMNKKITKYYLIRR